MIKVLESQLECDYCNKIIEDKYYAHYDYDEDDKHYCEECVDKHIQRNVKEMINIWIKNKNDSDRQNVLGNSEGYYNGISWRTWTLKNSNKKIMVIGHPLSENRYLIDNDEDVFDIIITEVKKTYHEIV